MGKKQKQLLWTGISVLLALLSIFAVLSQSKEMSLSDLVIAVRNSDMFWMTLAVLSMTGYIFFEGLALWYVLKQSGHPCRIRQGIVYAASDIYCASITPSATGGQPACAWFMNRDGINMGYVTAVLALNLIAHTFATMIIGLASVIISPKTFLELTVLAKILVVIGYILVTGLAVLFIFLLGMAKQIETIGYAIIDWLTKKGWVKQTDYWKSKLSHALQQYSTCLQVVRGKWRAFAILLLFNLLQRLSQTLVSPFVYLAGGGDVKFAQNVFAAQIYSAIGSMCMPIPGGMGVADYLLFCGLNSFLGKDEALALELLCRSCSFYLCVILSLVIVLIGYSQRHKFYFNVRKST